MDLDLLENVEIGEEIWNCVGAISKDGSSYFRIGDKWFISSKCNEIYETEVKEIEIAIYERIDMEDGDKAEKFFYKGADLEKLRSNTEQRKELNRKDRHRPTEKRKEHDRKDRHLPTEERTRLKSSSAKLSRTELP